MVRSRTVFALKNASRMQQRPAMAAELGVLARGA